MVSPNRRVALLTPIVAPLAAFGAAWLAEKVPGIDKGQLEAIFIAGMLAVLVPAAQWLRGWQQHEEREADFAHSVELATAGAPPAAEYEDYPEEPGDSDGYDGLEGYEDGYDDLDDLDDELFADDELAEQRS